MPRSIWSGAISFGLVNVPVRLVTAVSPKDVRFHMLHDKDQARVHMQRVCSLDEEEVPYEHIVKGYEIARGQYVVLTREELEALEAHGDHSIEIESFVGLDEIDPIYYENTYYLVPDRGAAKAYQLLVSAMRNAGKVGIAKMVMRTKQYLVAVRPLEDVLAMETLYFADEIVDHRDVDLPESRAKVSQRELEMAEQLIGALATEFDPTRYRDEYRERVLELIQKKAEGEEIAAPPAAEPRAQVVDLATALQASLRAAAEREPARKTPARQHATTKRKSTGRRASTTRRKSA